MSTEFPLCDEYVCRIHKHTFLKLAPKVPYNYIPNNTHIHKVCKSVLPGPRCQLVIMCGFLPTSSKFCSCFSVKNGSWIVTLIHIAYLLILGFIEIAFEPDFFDVSFLALGKFHFFSIYKVIFQLQASFAVAFLSKMDHRL